MISKIWTPLGLTVYALYLAIAIMVVGDLYAAGSRFDAYLPVVALGVVVCVAAVTYVKAASVRRRLGRRSLAISNLSDAYHLDKTLIGAPNLSTNFSQLQPRDPKKFNVLSAPDWRYCDFSQTLYHRFKEEEYKAADVYYSILELDLVRELPTMLFDSPKGHHKQFKVFFDKSQIHRLEGDFDQHFTTYFPKFYAIDALSIITPEVMQAMIDADSFDIEIDGSKLYLYGPLVPVEQLPAMLEHGQRIRQALMNNMVTYRDDRLEDAVARAHGVSVYGANLRHNPFRHWYLLLLGLALLVADAVYRLGVGVFIYGFWFAAAAGYEMGRTLHTNHKADKAYAEHEIYLENRQTQKRSMQE